jgi:hypothetical protein
VAERRTVAPEVAGSNPVTHPTSSHRYSVSFSSASAASDRVPCNVRYRARAGEALLCLGDATLLDGLPAGETMKIGRIFEFDSRVLAD